MTSSEILLSSEAKTAILQYVKMQDKVPPTDSLFKNKLSTSQSRLSSLLDYLDDSLLSDPDFRKQLLDLAIEKGYRINIHSKPLFKQNGTLAMSYYRDLLESNSIEGLLYNNILSPELLRNKEFLQNYIDLLSQKGIDKKTIIQTLTHDEECIKAFKTDTELFQSVFEQISPSNLEKFFNSFFSNEEIKEVLSNQDKLSGKLLHLSKLYAKDSTILESFNGEMLGERYQNIPDYKMQLIAKDSRFQDQLLGLNNYEYNLYSKMTQLVSQKTSRWNRFEYNIVSNLSEGHFGELTKDLYEQAKQGNKISSNDIETLTFLFSKTCLSDSYNVFNITNKKELEHYEEIKELVCDTILINPSLDDEQLTGSIGKYLKNFNQLSDLDRMKLALLEKYYNMDLNEASDIIKDFSGDIDKISAKDEYQASIVEQIKAIKNIYSCNDIDTLNKVGSLDVLVRADLSTSTYLIEQTKEVYEQAYKESLYMPQDKDKIGSTSYNGKAIEVFDANTDFSMIVKRVDASDKDSQEIWNSLTKKGEYNRKDLRYYTSTSYMTDENLLNMSNTPKEHNEIILGFAQGTKEYSFDGIYTQDSHTPFYGGDGIFLNLGGSYMTPSTLETNTDNNYNEIVINTLGVDSQGQMTKLQPDYLVYIKNQINQDLDGLEDDSVWKDTKKAASEFGIPIVVVDREKIKESEKSKIASMSETLDENLSSAEALRFVKKVEHYAARYGLNDVLEYAPESKMDFLKTYIEQRKLEEKENIATPNLDSHTPEEPHSNKQDILTRQAKLKKDNIITGDER